VITFSTNPGFDPAIGPYDIAFLPVFPGEFEMGTKLGYYPDAHKVTLTKGFQLGTYEVTQKQWRSVMGSNPSLLVGDKLPVETVSWNDVQEFIAILNARHDGWTYRLPTEAEWEYSIRAGTTTRYFWGDTFDEAYAWSYANSRGVLREVGTRLPNAWGFFDMAGNVWEWCQDYYGRYDLEVPQTDPTGPMSGSERVVRGGGYASDLRSLESGTRGRVSPLSSWGGLGFRLASYK